MLREACCSFRCEFQLTVVVCCSKSNELMTIKMLTLFDNLGVLYEYEELSVSMYTMMMMMVMITLLLKMMVIARTRERVVSETKKDLFSSNIKTLCASY